MTLPLSIISSFAGKITLYGRFMLGLIKSAGNCSWSHCQSPDYSLSACKDTWIFKTWHFFLHICQHTCLYNISVITQYCSIVLTVFHQTKLKFLSEMYHKECCRLRPTFQGPPTASTLRTVNKVSAERYDFTVHPVFLTYCIPRPHPVIAVSIS